MRSRHRQPGLTAAAAAVCALGLAGCATGGTAGVEPSPPAAEVAGAALETLLLEDPDIARIVDAPMILTVDTYAVMPDPAGRSYSDAFCGGAISSASTTLYQPATVTDVRGRRLADGGSDIPGTVVSRSVDQSVVVFPDAAAAREFVAAARTGWAACAGVSVETRDDAGRARWHLEQARYEGGVLSLSGTHPSGWVTEHAISAQGQIVIDVAVSSSDAVTDRAATIVRTIADRLSQ